MTGVTTKIATIGSMGGGLLLLAGCDLGPKDSTQTGYRGTGMDQVVDRSKLAKAAAIPPIAYALPADGGPTAASAYQNVPMLGSMSKDRFDHLMAEITQWVAPPEQGCNYCHNPENMASDEKYTKIVARRMLAMTRTINTRWRPHVKDTGVTCYTCHRGQPVPEYKWAMGEKTPNPDSIRGNKRGQNTPDANVGYASLPTDPFAAYFAGKASIRVASDKALPSPDHVVSIQDTERSYGLMMHVSSALGVNCTYCHNTQSFRAWNLSRAQRGTAYYGIRMVRDVNQGFISPLASVFPGNRKGPQGDPYKVNCTTCHQGVAKPLGGISMTAQAPWLKGPTSAPAPGAAGATAVPKAFNEPEKMSGSSAPTSTPK